MTYLEGSKYKLEKDYYEHLILTCTWVTYTTAYFKLDSNDQSLGSDYRLDIRSKKLHMWNSRCMSWDLIENTLSPYTAEDVWSKRVGKGNQTWVYDGSGQ
jgi:hypothetical protein